MNRPSSLSSVVSVDLGDKAARAREIVASGEFDSLDSLLQTALATFDEQQPDFTDAEIDALVARSAAEFDSGEHTVYSAEEAFALIDAHIAERRRARDAA